MLSPIRALAISLSLLTIVSIISNAVSSAAVLAPMTQIDIPGPTGSGAFGTQVALLPNGNLVVTDPAFDDGPKADVGAVYMYEGASLNLISQLKGDTAGDQIGSGGVTVLSNGNFVVRSSSWDNPVGPVADVGAVTWCSASVGCNGVVSASNSLVGGTANDQVGSNGLTALTNSNYVVSSRFWDNPAGPFVDAGAVTWGNGTGGTVGVVTSGNSLAGRTTGDLINVQVTALTNGNYVVSSPNWDNPLVPITDVGAVTWGNGMGGTVGLISPGNSLVGDTATDQIGFNGVTALTNGNYVVSSRFWDNPVGPITDVGAVTWGNGTGGTVGGVAPGNSLVGGTTGDQVGNTTPQSGSPAVRALTNGNYVVCSAFWDNPVGPIGDAGAATWCNGAGGTVGLISASNSLVGGAPGDEVGSNGVTALTNGNYVVNSSIWNNPAGSITDAGAVTWGNGTTGITGLVTSANSLVGTRAVDFVGDPGATALSNGNYVVASAIWDNPMGPVQNVGAATWGDGTTGISGPVTSANSLIGGTAFDFVAINGVTALTNGNYVVSSGSWDNPGVAANAGAATLGNGTTGTVGVVTASNSLVGGAAENRVGNNGATALTNGNYVVKSTLWDNPAGPIGDAGAATWGNGAGGTIGLVTASNSLVGGTSGDLSGVSVTPLPNGNYVVNTANWDNPVGPVVNAGATALGNGISGTSGLISSANSVLGTAGTGGASFSFAYDVVRNRLFVGRRPSSIVSILSFSTLAISDGNFDDPATWTSGVPNALTHVIIPSGRTITVNTPMTISSLELRAGATLLMNANLNLTGTLMLGTKLNTGNSTLGLGCSSTVEGASSTNYVIGNLKKDFCAPGSFSYPTGTLNGYTPVNTNVTALGQTPSSLTVKAVQATHPNVSAAHSLKRYWTLVEAGDLTADLTFNYLDPLDVTGNENRYKLIRIEGGTPAVVTPFMLDAGGNSISTAGVTNFSDWTAGNITQPVPPPADFDGDGRTDFSTFRPDSDGAGHARWYILNSGNASITQQPFGISTDKPVPGDYDGDGKADVAVFRPSSTIWYIFRSSDAAWTAQQFGQAEDIPVAADYDGDGDTDIAVYRPSTGFWFTSTNASTNYGAVHWGQAGDIPVHGFYDADNKMDIAIFRPSEGNWYIRRSSDMGTEVRPWGVSGDRLVPADYDGDGQTDLAVWRPMEGGWYILKSSTGYSTSSATQWGLMTDVPVPGDYDRDGRADIAVFRPATGVWYILKSMDGTSSALEWGLGGDRPVPAAYLPE